MSTDYELSEVSQEKHLESFLNLANEVVAPVSIVQDSPVVPSDVVPPIPNEDELDFGPLPIWKSFPCTVSGLFNCVSIHQVIPASSPTQLVATAPLTHFQLCRCTPICFPSSPWYINKGEASSVLTTAGNEISEFLAGAINEFSEDILRLNAKSDWWVFAVGLNLTIMLVILAIHLAIWIDIRTLVILALAFIVFPVLHIFSYCKVKLEAGKFSGQLARWIRDHRGPLDAIGIRPRPGYGGAFILFEIKMVS